MDEVIGAIDIGTNSIHLVIARVSGPDAFEVLAREKDVVRLGSGATDMKQLSPDAIDRGIAALGRFRQLADAHKAELLTAVATSALREADNRGAFVRRARAEAGIDVDVISGFEEARLIYLGALHALPVYDRRILLCDVGGGSTELLIGERGEGVAARSVKLGAIRLTQRFFGSTRLHPGAVDSCRRHIRATTAPFAATAGQLGFDAAVGSSGTLEALCHMALAAEGRELQSLNAFTLTRDALNGAVAAVIDADTPSRRAKLPGLDAGRADIILAGALIWEQIFEVFDLPEITFSDYALREGVLVDAWQRRHGGSLHHLSDLRRRSVLRLAETMDEDRSHTAHVSDLALQLFDATVTRHRLGDDAREYLEAAALLCNVGLFVSHAAHHKHSYYVIRNSEHLTGFTDREIELIALIARYHRKSAPKPSHPEFVAMDDDDQRMVRICAGLLRVAIGLDRSHDGRVVALAVSGKNGTLRVEAEARGDADVTLELFSADQHKGLLETALDVEVEVVTAPGCS